MQTLKQYIKTQKKKTAFALVVLFGFLLFGFFILHDDFLYKETILKITDVHTTFLSNKEGFDGSTEASYKQDITATVQNGSYKGQSVSFENEYSYSEVTSMKLQTGDKLFATLTKNSDNSFNVSILYEKRDSYLFLLFGIFIILLAFCAKKQGILTLLSLILNIATFFFCLSFYKTEDFLNWVWMLEVFCFCIITLLFVSGFRKKTLGAILSTLLIVVIVTVLYYVTIYHNDDIPYDMLPCMLAYLPLDKLFFISTIFGLLGAVMDVSITVNAAVSELVAATPNLSVKALIASIFEIGHDIMGTMVNVLFFSYFSSSFPLMVLKISNNYTFDTIVNVDYIFDILRFLVGSIGIVLSIPVSGLIAILLFKKGPVHKKW